MRGEKALRDTAHPLHGGSSPRAWGKVTLMVPLLPERRIIPTCVGKSYFRLKESSTPPDHPHVRGEKGQRCAHEPPTLGSSPRAWGKASADDTDPANGRIIPTCVGKSGLI